MRHWRGHGSGMMTSHISLFNNMGAPPSAGAAHTPATLPNVSSMPAHLYWHSTLNCQIFFSSEDNNLLQASVSSECWLWTPTAPSTLDLRVQLLPLST